MLSDAMQQITRPVGLHLPLRSFKNQRSFANLHSMVFQTGCARGFFQQAGSFEIPFEKVKEDGGWM